jgi:hypothetical protein
MVTLIHDPCHIRDFDGERCNQGAVAVWTWGGGPRLNACPAHDRELRQHVSGCPDCRKRLRRFVARIERR